MPRVYLFYIFLTSLLTSLVLIPTISKLAVSIGIFDGHDERKIHSGAIPRLGGIAIFFAVLLGTILYTEIDRHTRGFLAGAVVIFLTGLTDDLNELSPKKKLLGEIFAALIVTIVGDLRLSGLGDLIGTGPITLGYFSIPFTVFCIVGLVNAINLLDGLDGLAGGVTAIATAAIGVLAYNSGNHQLTGLCAAILGGVAGFLKFNSYPARIFMGDGGSLFLGFCLATLSIHVVEHSGGKISLMTPPIILAVPIFDTLFVMLKRLKNKQRVFSADRTHIHHRLMGLGLYHKATVIIVYGLTYFLCMYAITFQYLPEHQQVINVVLLIVFFCIMNRVLAMLLRNKENQFLTDNHALVSAFSFRWIIRYSQYLLRIVKYLLIAVLTLPLFIMPAQHDIELASIAGLMAIVIVISIVQSGDWSNRFLQLCLYFAGALVIFVVDNYGGSVDLAGLPMQILSLGLFTVLSTGTAVLLFLRKKSRPVMASPLEYFFLFAVVAMPLLPHDVTRQYHLLTVTGKSLILFLGYKLVFILDTRRNRKIILATLLALVTIALKAFI